MTVWGSRSTTNTMSDAARRSDCCAGWIYCLLCCALELFHLPSVALSGMLLVLLSSLFYVLFVIPYVEFVICVALLSWKCITEQMILREKTLISLLLLFYCCCCCLKAMTFVTSLFLLVPVSFFSSCARKEYWNYHNHLHHYYHHILFRHHHHHHQCTSSILAPSDYPTTNTKRLFYVLLDRSNPTTSHFLNLTAW